MTTTRTALKTNCLLILPLLFALASEPASADTATPVTLWQVEGENNQVYLLGSVHLLRESDYPLPAIIDRAYEDAEHLIMELDMDDIDPVATQAAVSRMGLLNDGRTLADVLGRVDYAKAERAARELDIPLKLLAGSEPWFAAITIEQMLLARMGFNPLYGVEMAMLSKAQKDNKTVDGLETLEEQLGFLDGLTADAQRDLLLQTLEQGRDAEPLMDSLIAAWKDGDTEYLEANMLRELQDYPELYTTIVSERNERWLDRLTALLDDDDDYLVVVGALHLIGDDGLPALLRARGVEVGQLGRTSSLPLD
ncbi:MAG: TraB/GumN family protein [Pseudomonadota bacterium]